MSDLSTAIETFLGLPGLRGFWPLNSFDESGNAYDISQFNQHLTYTGNPTYNVNPKGAGYLDFDGTGDYLTKADAATLDILGNESYVASGVGLEVQGLTYGCWAYFDSTSGTPSLIAKYTSDADGSYRMSLSSSGQFRSHLVLSSGISTYTSQTLSTGRWYFLVARFGRGFTNYSHAAFINGVKAESGVSATPTIVNSGTAFTIGASAAGANPLNGRIALAFICGEAVSDAVLADLYEASWALFNDTVSAAETITLTETVSRKLVSLVSQNQAVTLTEAQTLSMARRTSQAETITLSETATAAMVRQLSAADTITLTETVSRNLVDLVAATETVTLSEAQIVNMVRPVLAAETVTLTETATAYMLRSVSAAETVTLSEAQSVILAGLVSQAETITLSEVGTTVVLIAVVGQNETVTLTEGVNVTIGTFSTLGVDAAETVTVGEIVLISTDTSRLINVSELVTLTEGVTATLFEIVTIVISDTLGLVDVADSPILNIADTLTLTDSIVGTTIADTLTLTDTVTIGNVTMVIEDTLTFSEVLELDGPAVTPPAAPATGGLNTDGIVLKLLYGNDRRNPIRTLDIAQLDPGGIRLMAGGFAPGAGERTQLWSGESVHFDGQDLLAESLKNSELAITYGLRSAGAGSGQGSQAALSYFQRQITRFFTEAKLHQVQHNKNHTVWLEYRWPDGLNDLPTPSFGQLSTFYEVFSATAPKWPDSLHNDIQDLNQGLIAGVVMNVTGSPAPEGLKQRLAIAAGAISLHDKGVLIASGSSSKLHWAAYTPSGLTGQFHITGWITLNAAWGSGMKDVFDYYVDASNRIRILYDAGNNRWTITKIVGGSTFTTNSSTDAVANGDDVHLQLVQDATTLYLYVNGVLAASVTATATMTDGGLIALGCPGTGTIDGVDVILDGWRIMPDDVTSTQALALYEAELPIKQDGGQVGPPPYWWTTDGDGQVDSCDDATHDNWGVIGGIGGEIEARLDIRLKVSDTASKHYWLGVKTQDDQFTPSSYVWFETGGSSVGDALSSADSYGTSSGTSITMTNSKTSLDPDLVLGKYHWLYRVRTSGTATVTPGWFFSNTMPINIKAVSVTNAAFKVISLGDTFIETDGEMVIDSGTTIPLALRVAVSAATSVTFDTDFALLLPAPFAKITQPDHASANTPSSTKPLVIEDGHAHVFLAGGTQSDRYEYQGDKLVALPNKYNYLFLLRLNSSDDFLKTNVTDVSVYVTPRYLLPGGMVA